MSFLENIKLIASELASMSPRTQLEIVKLCKELCIEVKNYLVELDETTLTNITTRITNLESATTSLQNLYNELADELQTAEGNITANANAIETLQTSVEAITEALEGIYTKSQVDALLSAKADKLDTYTKTEVNTLLNAKADASNVYAKADTYNKTEVNTLLNDKADKATTYTKTEVDTALSGKASLSSNNTFSGTNTFNNGTHDISVFDGDSIYFRDYDQTINDLFSETQRKLYKYHIILELYNKTNNYNEYAFNADMISNVNIDTNIIINQFIDTWAKYQIIHNLLNNAEISGVGLNHDDALVGTFYIYNMDESDFNDITNDFCEFGYYDSLNTDFQYDTYNRQNHELKIKFISKTAL